MSILFYLVGRLMIRRMKLQFLILVEINIAQGLNFKVVGVIIYLANPKKKLSSKWIFKFFFFVSWPFASVLHYGQGSLYSCGKWVWMEPVWLFHENWVANNCFCPWDSLCVSSFSYLFAHFFFWGPFIQKLLRYYC